MSVHKRTVTLSKWLLISMLYAPFVSYAQVRDNKIDSTNKSTKLENVRLSRVLDPLSSNTVWIDKYLTSIIDFNDNPQGNNANKVVFKFRVNSSVFEQDYMDNGKSLEIASAYFSDSAILKNGTLIVVTGTASPEGNFESNEKLSAQRALSIKNYIIQRYPGVNRDNISTYSAGEQWDNFRILVERDNSIPERNQVIRILNLNLPGKEKINRIKGLNGGLTYQYLSQYILPNLRGGVSCTFYKLDPHTKEPIIIQTTPYLDNADQGSRVDTLYLNKTTEILVDRGPKKLFLAVKTNILYDLGLLPNLSLEIPIGKRLSVEIEGMESWWNTKNSNRYYHRIQTAALEFRTWIGNRYNTPLTGHFIGVYGMGGTYDIKLNSEKGSLSNWSYSAGITYGYSTPIGRRLNLEFAIGVGFVSGEYKTYRFNPENDCYPLIDVLNRSYFGPTKAKVSLVYLIGNGFKDRIKK